MLDLSGAPHASDVLHQLSGNFISADPYANVVFVSPLGSSMLPGISDKTAICNFYVKSQGIHTPDLLAVLSLGEKKLESLSTLL